MPAYIIAQMTVHDAVKYREYALQVASTIGPHKGKLLVAADDADEREGERPYPRTVIGEFPDGDAARAWYESDAYQAIAPLRQQSSTGTLYIVEGFSLPA
jgi:uncharacterized protein (DUF1330 family)